MNINKICIVALLCACASMRIAAQDFYADYGIADPAVFSAMQRQSNALIMQQAQAMQRQQDVWNAACAANANRPVDAATRYNAFRMAQDMQMQTLQMQSDSIDAEMSAEAWRQRGNAVMREKADRQIAAIQGVTYDQYRTAKSMELYQETGSAENPRGDETLYSDRYGNLYRVDMNGRAYQQLRYGESRIR